MKNANLVSRWLALSAAVTLATASIFCVAGCDNDAARAAAALEVQPVNAFFPIKVGDAVVRMQVAVSQTEQQRGLMQRRDLGADDGMLFPYRKPQAMSFWMHNTPTPLDIGFFDAEGVLVEIYPLQPFDETSVKSRSKQLKFALEMNQGWFAAHGVRPGAKLDLTAVAEALKARGAEARDYGLGE